jgi:hypothetical protein
LQDITPANDGLYPACVIIVTSANPIDGALRATSKQEIIVISLQVGD